MCRGSSSRCPVAVEQPDADGGWVVGITQGTMLQGSETGSLDGRHTHCPNWCHFLKFPVGFKLLLFLPGQLADKPVTPQDANMMQTAETMIFGQTQKGGPAGVMQSAATRNEKARLVPHDKATDVAGSEGVTVSKTMSSVALSSLN
ncbi:hypothetical protein ACFX15_021609 [Malus domestica]